VTGAVATENVEVCRPFAVAVTRTVSRFPTSPARTTYDAPVAPAIGRPAAYHWTRFFAVDGDQRPALAVSLVPTVGEPWMLGVVRGTGPRPQV